ncbi:MAG: glutamate-1-semialdehyde 2,1-aminomutase [Bradymonadaceae bacterium]|nr:glutamate-1-semialdehyde 2,1-aminomutase [Lujinxingiaceae bacterium]
MLNNSRDLLKRAEKLIPGGVNSPVRAFKSVGGTPPFIARAEGAYLHDADNNRYIDFMLSWGPAILGHAHPEVIKRAQEALARGSSFGAPTELEVELAEEMVARVPGLEMVRLVCSGTEACMSAIRVARGATGRDKFIKFDGCYHGHADSFLIAAGSGALTLGLPNSPGVTKGCAKDTLLAPFNDIKAVQALVDANTDQIAAIILEPICGNTGLIAPGDTFLQDLRTICTRHGIVLIFDEVMTGFRVARGGAAELYKVTPDLYTFGKVVGGGFPLAAYGGRADLMSQIAPSGPIYQAGTLSGNPVAVTAGLTTLRNLPQAAYDQLEATGQRLEDGLQNVIDYNAYPLTQQRVGSMFCLYFSPEEIRNHTDVKTCDIPKFNAFFHHMLDAGVYLAPSQYEAGFLSTAHTDDIIDEVVDKATEALEKVFQR